MHSKAFEVFIPWNYKFQNQANPFCLIVCHPIELWKLISSTTVQLVLEQIAWSFEIFLVMGSLQFGDLWSDGRPINGNKGFLKIYPQTIWTFENVKHCETFFVPGQCFKWLNFYKSTCNCSLLQTNCDFREFYELWNRTYLIRAWKLFNSLKDLNLWPNVQDRLVATALSNLSTEKSFKLSKN